MASRVHIIDPDPGRHSGLAREFTARQIDARIYDDLDQFGRRPPRDGFVFVADDEAGDWGPSDVSAILQKSDAALPVVMYANQPTPERIVSAMLSGALDYLEWPFRAASLDTAFRRLAAQENRRAAQDRLRFAAEARVRLLTTREREVLAQVAIGLANKEIARVLKISHRTVEIHRGNMMRKLDAHSTADAVRIALYAEVCEMSD